LIDANPRAAYNYRLISSRGQPARAPRHTDVPPQRPRKRALRQMWRGLAATVCLQTAAGCPVLQPTND